MSATEAVGWVLCGLLALIIMAAIRAAADGDIEARIWVALVVIIGLLVLLGRSS